MENKELIGVSAKFGALLDAVDLVGKVDSTVLIQGETGTGKEVIARAIHEASLRRKNRFVALNCAAIPSTLLESELFGFEKGAFTGAVAQTLGRFQAADHGTIFLDEIGDLPLELQPKLLRVLQEKQIERLGGGQTLKVDVRVIAATNQDLGQMVQERRFRADLYYRLNVFPMTLPPLRERRIDIRPLVEYFVAKFAKQQGKTIEVIPDRVLSVLEQHDWPGNIRELQNVVERGVIMTSGPVLSCRTTETLMPGQLQARYDTAPIETETLADAQRTHIAKMLRETRGVVGGRHGAAARLGLPRTTLLARMQRLGISVRAAGIGGRWSEPSVIQGMAAAG
jgi:formate hydrogenlyase transcriptional activator